MFFFNFSPLYSVETYKLLIVSNWKSAIIRFDRMPSQCQ